MIFYIFVFIFVTASVVYKLDKKGRFNRVSDLFMCIGAVGSLLLLFLIMEFHLIGACNYADKVERYDKLMYQIDSGYYQYNTLDEIEEWNTEIKLGKKYQYNFWVGIICPNMYDEFELIDYSSYQPN